MPLRIGQQFDIVTAEAGAAALRSHQDVASRELPRGMLPGIASGLIAIGLLFGMGGPLWPDVLDAFEVSKSQFGLMSGLGLALSLPVLLFGSRITQSAGNFNVLLVAVLMLAGSAVLIAAIEGGILVLVGIILIRGMGIALSDLTANTLTMDAERILGRHLMGPLHAMFSAGSIAGAGAVAVGLAVSLSFRSLYAGLAVALLMLAVLFVFPKRAHDRSVKALGAQRPIQFRLALSSPLIRLCGLLTALSFAG
ncbi:MAG: sugar MFS transporter, partial [Thermomicrobiales bacterium]